MSIWLDKMTKSKKKRSEKQGNILSRNLNMAQNDTEVNIKMLFANTFANSNRKAVVHLMHTDYQTQNLNPQKIL